MRIVELKLYTTDLKIQFDFYHKVLGLPLVGRKTNKISIQVGRTTLVFEQCKGEVAPYYHFAINISENKIQQALEWLGDKVKVTEDNQEQIIDFQSWNAHSIYFDDPAGNIVELIARHNLKNGSPQKEFTTMEDFHCIDEIGMPFSNVLEAVETIKSEYKLQNWKPASSNFATVGDENGLFIVVRLGRKWYMSDKPAVEFPLEVSFLEPETEKVRRYIYN